MTNLATPEQWAETLKLVDGLWPKWEPTEEERALWRRRLRGLNQPRLRGAVEEHRMQPPRPGVSQANPNIGEILKLFRGQGNTISGTRKRGPSLTDAQIYQVEREREDMLDELLELEPAPLIEAMTCAFPHYMIFQTGCFDVPKETLERRCADAASNIPTDPRRWPPDLIGFTWAQRQGATAL